MERIFSIIIGLFEMLTNMATYIAFPSRYIPALYKITQMKIQKADQSNEVKLNFLFL